MKNNLYMIISLSFIILSSTTALTEIQEGKPLMWGFVVDPYPVTEEKIKRIEAETALNGEIFMFFLQWQSNPEARGFPLESLNKICVAGALPVISWEPMFYEKGIETMVDYKKILNREYDPYLNYFADESAKWGKPFIIRFAHEMNLERYHWGTDHDGYGPESPEIYKDMFRYIVVLFRERGADNVLWAFCPNSESVPDISYNEEAGWNRASNYYPGSGYVDILGMDGYNWGTSRNIEKHGWQSSWKSFRETFEPLYREIKSLSSEKPVIVFETATTEKGGDKNTWIKDAVRTATEWQLDGVVWFNVEKEEDWRINSHTDSSYIKLITQATSYSQMWIKNIRR